VGFLRNFARRGTAFERIGDRVCQPNIHAAYLAVLWSALTQILSALIGPPRGNARSLVDKTSPKTNSTGIASSPE
jgi:hypothetical protein